MCVIIHKERGAKLDINELRAAAVTNPDGFSINTNGKIFKTLDINAFINEARKIKDEDAVTIWCRISTGGGNTIDNIQPFKVSKNLVMYHNGICGKSEGCKSDTRLLAERLMNEYNDDYEREDVLFAMARSGAGRFMLVDNMGTLEKATPNNVVDIDENGSLIFRSNKYHLPRKYAWYKNYGNSFSDSKF